MKKSQHAAKSPGFEGQTLKPLVPTLIIQSRRINHGFPRGDAVRVQRSCIGPIQGRILGPFSDFWKIDPTPTTPVALSSVVTQPLCNWSWFELRAPLFGSAPFLKSLWKNASSFIIPPDSCISPSFISLQLTWQGGASVTLARQKRLKIGSNFFMIAKAPHLIETKEVSFGNNSLIFKKIPYDIESFLC